MNNKGGEEMRLEKDKTTLLMARRGYSQKDLADAINMSRGNLSTIINGKNCHPKTALRIAEALGVEVTDIIE